MATITYNGVTHRPNNATSPDGDLALCLNLVNDNGALTPLEKPTHIGTMPQGFQALYIHESVGYKHIIAYDTTAGNVIWIGFDHFKDLDWEEQEHWGYVTQNVNEAPSVASLGNTLILTYKSKPIQYAVWKENSYNTLASHPPFIPMQFALLADDNEKATQFNIERIEFNCESSSAVGHFEIINEVASNRNSQEGGTNTGDGTMIHWGDLPSSNLIIDRAISQQWFENPILGALNKAIADKTTNPDKSARFIFPFLVRYAIRFYDGSLTQHSYPVLMIPNSHVIARITDMQGSISQPKEKEPNKKFVEINNLNGVFDMDACSLHYWFPRTPELDNWKDLIDGIDVYISAPLYTYDQSGYVKGWCKKGDINITSALRVSNTSFGEEEQTEKLVDSKYQIILPTKENAAIQSMVEGCSLFYKAISVPFKDIVDSDFWQPLNIKGSIFEAITSQELMSDDFNTHHDKQATSAMVYNSRLNLAGVSEVIKADVPFACQFGYLDKGNISASGAVTLLDNNSVPRKIRTARMHEELADTIGCLPRYFFFPTTRASQIDLTLDNITYKIPLKEHVGLNGSVYFRGFGNILPDTIAPTNDAVDSITVKQPNQLYTSEVDNPFTFRPTNINTIGSGTIYALSAATQAISQGQFGAFPLYAFTDEGIWALQVSSTGGWQSIQPISRDVISAGSKPLNIDNAVVFFSARGLMLLQGGDVTCLSALLDSDNEITLPADNVTTEQFPTEFLDAVKRFPKIASLAYDYAHSRIYVLSNNVYWVYSFRSGTWSHAIGCANGATALNDYPNTILVENQSLSSLDADCGKYEYASLITRPLKFESTSLRTIRSVVTRGLLNTDSFKSILTASVNNRTFVPLAGTASHDIRRISGSAYRSHYLSLILTGLSPDFAINSTEFDVVVKHTNKMR